MALSFQEKRTLQKEIADCASALENAPDFKAKRILQKRLSEAFARLEGSMAKAGKSLLDRLLADEFLSESPVKFLSIIKKILTETNDALESVREPVMKYLRAHYNESEGIFEGVFLLGNPPASLDRYSSLPDFMDRRW